MNFGPTMTAYLEARIAFVERPNARIAIVDGAFARQEVFIEETIGEKQFRTVYTLPRTFVSNEAYARMAERARRKHDTITARARMGVAIGQVAKTFGRLATSARAATRTLEGMPRSFEVDA